ncbi:hypothetical protein CERZMDRAFT_98872 [Cercospora zeae-maydis SCOH1-5]|uniref:Uncharacterized protein n=1 Tax=Cercospora zeae-maydis SCOH1-5 TaxID=717836 RepID=A0A6A6FCL8_9PEZI|nr:hypothetical protein CERZMDRAFT_98872 [Cercospora zeae-maydis SCOH1-5]
MVSSRLAVLLATTLLASNSVVAQDTTATSSAPSTAPTGVPTEVTSCHSHSDGYYCFEGESEWKVSSEIADEDQAPEEYTACTAGENENTIQCNDASGAQVTLVRDGEEEHDHDHDSGDQINHDHDHSHAEESASGSASPTANPSATGVAAETSETAAGNAGNAVIPAAGMSLMALFAYLLV